MHWDWSGQQKQCCMDIYIVAKARTKFHGLPLFMWFVHCIKVEECKTSPPSNKSDFTSLFSADSNERYGRRDNIRIDGVEVINEGDVYERLVELANYNGVTISKQDISVCHRLPSKNWGSSLKLAKFVRRETKFRVVTHRGNLKNSSRNFYNDDDVTLLQAKRARGLRQGPDVIK